MQKILLLLLLSFIVSFSTHPQRLASFPQNDLYIGVDDKGYGGITLNEFNGVLDRLELIYAPVIRELNREFVVERSWEDGTVNAYARQRERKMIIEMMGGLARFPLMTKDAFALLACHEIGHHLGGAPKKETYYGTMWASSEGQSDYFATLKCMRLYLAGFDNRSVVEKMEIHPLVEENCSQTFSEAEDRDICIRTAMAGETMALVFKAVSKKNVTKPSFDTPDTAEVKLSLSGHPDPQCRLDTYFAGALCHKNVLDKLDDLDIAKGACARKFYDTTGVRPRCWFKPPV